MFSDQAFRQCVHIGISERRPAQLLGFHVDHTTPSDRWLHFKTCALYVYTTVAGAASVCVAYLLTVAGEACSRSAGSKIRLILGLIWMISPLIRHS